MVGAMGRSQGIARDRQGGWTQKGPMLSGNDRVDVVGQNLDAW